MWYDRARDPQMNDKPEAPKGVPCPRHRFNHVPTDDECWFCEQDREVEREDKREREEEQDVFYQNGWK